MGPSVNVVLGIAFLVCGVAASLLMFHLWGYPYDNKTHTSSAPRWLTNVHRLLGFIYIAIYVALMWQMFPRLWTYQVELPARTVVHLTLGLAIGAMLLVKISIVRFFRHLEGTLVPFLGTGLLLATFLVIGLSVPFALREEYLNRQAINELLADQDGLKRVEDLLLEAGLTDENLRRELSTADGLRRGRTVLHRSCIECHDLRAVLVRPRTAENWRATVARMAERSDFLAPINEARQWAVTAYLIAISPRLQRAAAEKTSTDGKSNEAAETLAKALKATESSEESQSKNEGDLSFAKTTFEKKCSQCHELELVQSYQFTDRRSVEAILHRMTKEGLTASEQEYIAIYHYLIETFVGKETKQEKSP